MAQAAPRAAGLTGAARRLHALRAATSASGHAPSRPSTSAWCRKQWPRYKTSSCWVSHQRWNDAVQDRQRREVEELCAGVDHRAVRIARREQRQLARFDRHHGFIEEGHPVGDLCEVDEHAALTDAGKGDELTMGETGTDLAGSDEVVVGPRQVAGFEDPEHAQTPFEIALLDAVDTRFVQEASDPVDPTAATAEVSFEPESLGDLAPEVCRPVQLAAIGTEPVGPSPMGEALLVAAGEVGGGCESVEILDVDDVGVGFGEQAPGVAPAVGVERRTSFLDRSHHVYQSCLPPKGGQPKKASAWSACVPRNIHISAMRSPSKR